MRLMRIGCSRWFLDVPWYFFVWFPFYPVSISNRNPALQNTPEIQCFQVVLLHHNSLTSSWPQGWPPGSAEGSTGVSVLRWSDLERVCAATVPRWAESTAIQICFNLCVNLCFNVLGFGSIERFRWCTSMFLWYVHISIYSICQSRTVVFFPFSLPRKDARGSAPEELKWLTVFQNPIAGAVFLPVLDGWNLLSMCRRSNHQITDFGPKARYFGCWSPKSLKTSSRLLPMLLWC